MLTSLLIAAFQASTPLPPVSELLDCAREADITLVAAHRAGGFAPGIPENSLAGFREAARLGAAFVEVDLMETSDGEIILMHDRTLDRTTTGEGEVADHTLAELRTLHLLDSAGRRTHERIPTLEDTFAAARELGIYIELDLKGIAPERAAWLVAEAGMETQTIIIVYDVADADPIQAISTDIGISLPFIDRNEVLNSDLDFDPLISWVGYGVPDARTEYFLSGQNIETAMHDFPGEREGTIDYAFIDERHIELLASDDPEAALAVFGRWDLYCPLN